MRLSLSVRLSCYSSFTEHTTLVLQDKAIGWGSFTSPDFYNVANDKNACLRHHRFSVSLHVTYHSSIHGLFQLLTFILLDLLPAVDAKGAKPED